MPPSLILDKSAFQGLGTSEHNVARFMFTENLTPVLLREILADLAKPTRNQPAEALVQGLAQKFLGSGGVVNDDWRCLCMASLLGNSLPMNGQIIARPDAVHGSSDERGGSVLIGPTEENYAIIRWAEAQFGSGEKPIAEGIRREAESFQLDTLAGRLRGALPQARSIEEIPLLVNQVLHEQPDPDGQILHWVVDQLRPLAQAGARIPKLRRQLVWQWRRDGHHYWDSAPYALHCARTLLTLLIGAPVLSQRPTNRVDVEYLLYLPFCHVFVSGDKLHRQLAPALLREDQTFVHLEPFKRDLARNWLERDTASAEVRSRRDRCFGSRPWPAPGCVLWALWEKYQPWRATDGNRAIHLPGPEYRRAVAEAKALVAQANDLLAPSG